MLSSPCHRASLNDGTTLDARGGLGSSVCIVSCSLCLSLVQLSSGLGLLGAIAP